MKFINLALINPDIATAAVTTQNDIATFIYEDCWSQVSIGEELTLEMVQALLKGNSLARKNSIDERRVEGQIKAWWRLLDLIEDEEFSVTADIAFQLASFNSYPIATLRPIKKTKNISDIFYFIAESLKEYECVFDRAFLVFLSMVLMDIYNGYNLNTARMMMNGVLLSSGYPAASFPIIHRQKFFSAVALLDETNDHRQLYDLMRSSFDERVIRFLSYDVCRRK